MRYNKTLGKRRPLLINMLINIKSHYYPRFVYRDKETRCQLMLIKNGQKSWSGDVLYFFKKNAITNCGQSHLCADHIKAKKHT